MRNVWGRSCERAGLSRLITSDRAFSAIEGTNQKKKEMQRKPHKITILLALGKQVLRNKTGRDKATVFFLSISHLYYIEQTIETMTESKTNLESPTNEETYASSIYVIFLGRLIRFFLVQAFRCLSMASTIVSFIVDVSRLSIESTKQGSASEYILDKMGEYEGDGDDLIEAPPFRLSWPVNTNVSLRRIVQESNSQDSADSTQENRDPSDHERSTKRRRSPRSSRFKNEFAGKSKSFAKRIRTERTKLLATVAEQHMNDQALTPTRIRKRSVRIKNELAEKGNSITELLKTEGTKLVEKGNSIAERIQLQERSTNIVERIQTERTKLNDRKTAIAERMKVAKRNSFKINNRGRSFSENMKFELMG